MDRLDAMRLFTRVVERRSFTEAAHDLGIYRSTATQVIKQLEGRLGVRLLQRTTRAVRPTLDGEAYYRRCLAILDEVEDAEGAFRGTAPKGVVRVEVHGTLARHFLFSGLPNFLARYPDIEVVISEGDRFVDLVREGVDCAIRVGVPPLSDLVARRLATLEEVTLASAGYIQQRGLPREPGDLQQGHRMVGFHSSVTRSVLPLEFTVDGKISTMTLPSVISVTAAESYYAAATLGLGLIQVPRYHAEADLSSGRMVQLLPDYPPTPTPVSVLYPRNGQLSRRVRLFIDWAVERFAGRD